MIKAVFSTLVLAVLMSGSVSVGETPVIKHFPEASKCATCHIRADDNTNFRLLTGDKANSVPEMCGQCHGIVKRDWDLGIHGKQVGGWKQSTPLVCTSCHNPHDPKFKLMKALKAPNRPRFGIKKESHHE